jgi:uncharacterized protein
LDLEHQLRVTMPNVPWEVTNQAAVHLWFEEHFGHKVSQLHSLADAVSTWPEYSTSVGVTLDERELIRVIAPFGLDDLFSMVVRRNPKRVSIETYRERVRSKRYNSRWPKVKIIEC